MKRVPLSVISLHGGVLERNSNKDPHMSYWPGGNLDKALNIDAEYRRKCSKRLPAVLGYSELQHDPLHFARL